MVVGGSQDEADEQYVRMHYRSHTPCTKTLSLPTSCAGLLASYAVALSASAAAATRLAWLMAARHRAKFFRTLILGALEGMDVCQSWV